MERSRFYDQLVFRWCKCDNHKMEEPRKTQQKINEKNPHPIKKILKLALSARLAVIFSIFHVFSIAAIRFANNARDCYTCLSYEVHEWLTRWRCAIQRSFCMRRTHSHMDLVNWATKTMLNDPLCENLTENRHKTMFDASNVSRSSFFFFFLFAKMKIQRCHRQRRSVRRTKFNSQFQSVAHSMNVTL